MIRNKNIGKIAAFEKCLNECFLLLAEEDNKEFSSKIEKYISLNNEKIFKNENSKQLFDIFKDFEEAFLNKRDLIDLKFLQIDFVNKFYETLLMNLDYIMYFFYKRDFNSAFAHIFYCFHYFIIIYEEKNDTDMQKIENLLIDFFANVTETCTGYIKHTLMIVGTNQALFYVNHFSLLIEKFLTWKCHYSKNIYLLKSLIDYYMDAALISRNPNFLLKTIKMCHEIIIMHIPLTKERIEEEIDKENIKIEKSNLYKLMFELKNPLEKVSICNVLQSLSFSYTMHYILAKNDKYFIFFLTEC